MATINKGENGIRRIVDLTYEEAIDRVTETLKDQGFGILSQTDIKATMEKKGQPWPGQKYVILHACNPPFAFKALMTTRDVGLILPCNVVVYEIEEKKTQLIAINPEISFKSLVGEFEGMGEMAMEVQKRLKTALDKM